MTLTMTNAEIFKIRKHRMPLVLTAIGSAVAAGPGIYYFFKAPEAAIDYADSAVVAFGAFALLAGAVFGGWVLGHEYRQETLRRAVAVDARRGRLIASKALAGLAVFTAMLATMLATGLGVGALAAASHSESLLTADLGRNIASGIVPVFVALAAAFGASAVFRSDTYATLFSLGILVILGPLLNLIPKVGDYMLGALVSETSVWISDSVQPAHGGLTTLMALAAWIVVIAGAGAALFNRRDI